MTDRQNIILVTADSVRADYCGFLGGPDTTPFLSNTASDAIVFENTIAPGPRTPSSVPITMTGEWYRDVGDKSTTNRLTRIGDHIKRFQTIGERLKRRGYTTAALTANPWITTTTGFDDRFDEFREIGAGYGNDEERSSTRAILDYIDQWRKSTDWFAQWTNYYDDVRERLERLEEPWFLWVFLLDTHSPYIVPREYRTESNLLSMYYSVVKYNLNVMRSNPDVELSPRVHDSLVRAYRDSIRSVDGFLQRLNSDVDRERTSIVFNSDHGESMRDHGQYGHQPQLYEENIRVPMAILSSDQPTRVSNPVSLVELPTLVTDLADGSMNPETYTSDFVYSQTEFGDAQTIRGSRYKLISRETSDSVKLYDLKNDATERRNVADEMPKVTDVLETHLNTRKRGLRERVDISQAVSSVTR